ncbi:hypothetical protein ACRAWD_22205 [Caulobacter segnis]
MEDFAWDREVLRGMSGQHRTGRAAARRAVRQTARRPPLPVGDVRRSSGRVRAVRPAVA